MLGINGWEALLLAVPLLVVIVVVPGVLVLLRRSAELRRRVAALEAHRPAGAGLAPRSGRGRVTHQRR